MLSRNVKWGAPNGTHSAGRGSPSPRPRNTSRGKETPAPLNKTTEEGDLSSTLENQSNTFSGIAKNRRANWRQLLSQEKDRENIEANGNTRFSENEGEGGYHCSELEHFFKGETPTGGADKGNPEGVRWVNILEAEKEGSCREMSSGSEVENTKVHSRIKSTKKGGETVITIKAQTNGEELRRSDGVHFYELRGDKQSVRRRESSDSTKRGIRGEGIVINLGG